MFKKRHARLVGSIAVVTEILCAAGCPFSEVPYGVDPGPGSGGSGSNISAGSSSRENICGDGILAGEEICDDGNISSNDGCESECKKITDGFQCKNDNANVLSICNTICGNGKIQGAEMCDDGNLTDADGCNSDCNTETRGEVEQNGNIKEANNNRFGIIDKDALVVGKATSGYLDIFKIAPLSDSVVRFEAFDSSGLDCLFDSEDLNFRLLDQSENEVYKYEDTGDRGIKNCPALTVNIAGGHHYYAAISCVGCNSTPYMLEVNFQQNFGNESGDNSDYNDSDVLPGSNWAVRGSLGGSEIDFYAVFIPQNRSIRAEIVESGVFDDCSNMRSKLTLMKLNDSNTEHLTDDKDSGRGGCSLIDGTGSDPLDPEANGLAAGMYVLAVESDNQSALSYHLTIVAR